MLASAQLGGPPRASSRPYTPLTASIAGSEVIAAVRVVRVVPATAQNGTEVETSLLRAFKGSPAGPRLMLTLAPFEQDLVYRLVPGWSSIVPHPDRWARDVSADRREPAFLRGVGRRVSSTQQVRWYRHGRTRPMASRRSSFPITAGDREDAESVPLQGWRGGSPLVGISQRVGPRRAAVSRLAARIAHSLGPPRGAERRGSHPAAGDPHVDATEIREFFSQTRTGSRKCCGRERRSSSTWIGSTSPRRGGGYRERLDFRYYPMPSPGEYTIGQWGTLLPFRSADHQAGRSNLGRLTGLVEASMSGRHVLLVSPSRGICRTAHALMPPCFGTASGARRQPSHARRATRGLVFVLSAPGLDIRGRGRRIVGRHVSGDGVPLGNRHRRASDGRLLFRAVRRRHAEPPRRSRARGRLHARGAPRLHDRRLLRALHARAARGRHPPHLGAP